MKSCCLVTHNHYHSLFIFAYPWQQVAACLPLFGCKHGSSCEHLNTTVKSYILYRYTQHMLNVANKVSRRIVRRKATAWEWRKLNNGDFIICIPAQVLTRWPISKRIRWRKHVACIMYIINSCRMFNWRLCFFFNFHLVFLRGMCIGYW